MSQSVLFSALLPVPHGFSTRHGGVSTGAWASLNVGGAVGDDPEHVAENVRRLSQEVGCLPEDFATVSQVHGCDVVEADRGSAPGRQADAVWSRTQGVAVGVKTADCVPILLVDPEGKRVAAVHSGWRGTDLEVAGAAVSELERQGARAGRLLAAIGPSIRVCCYEVSDDLARRFSDRFGPEVVASDGGKPHLDLVRAIEATLKAHGVRESNIDVLPRCTMCEPADFFSHRRDRGVTGRHLSFAVQRF